MTGAMAIVQLTDAFSHAPIDDASAIFQHGETIFEPVRQRNGFCVFTGLSDASPQSLSVSCPGFCEADVALKVFQVSLDEPLTEPLAGLIVVLHLNPGATYSYPAGTALLSGQVTSGGKPLAGAEVFALFLDHHGTWQWRKTVSYGAQRSGDRLGGHYTLAVPRNAVKAEANLRFAKDGFTSHFHRVAVTQSTTTTVSADLQPAIA